MSSIEGPFTPAQLEHETLTTFEVSLRLRVSPRRVIALADEGVLPALRTPNGRLYPVAAVERLAAQRELA